MADLSKHEVADLHTLQQCREMMKKGSWWGTQAHEWLIGQSRMDKFKRLKLVAVDIVGDSSFAVITPKGERALAHTSQPQ